MELVNETLQELMKVGLTLIRAPIISATWSILALLAAVLGYFYVPYCGVRRIPGPVAIPFVGNLPLLAKYGPDLFSVLANRYGPIFRFDLLTYLFIAICVHKAKACYINTGHMDQRQNLYYTMCTIKMLLSIAEYVMIGVMSI